MKSQETERVERIIKKLQPHILSFLEENESDPSYWEDNLSYDFSFTDFKEGPLAEENYDHFLREIFEASKKGVNTTSPLFMGFIPGGGVPESALAGFISQIINRYVGCAFMAPTLVKSEMEVIKWLCKIIGFESGGMGILTSGGSMANFSAVLLARDQVLKGFPLNEGTAYFSDQTHYGIPKALHMAGIPRENFREIKSNSNGQLDLRELEKSIQSDRKKGNKPFFINGNAGTTNSGAVDDLDWLGDFSSNNQIWFHLDGAYGGLFLLSDYFKEELKGAHRADSITLDPHKGLFLPYGTGALCVKNGELLNDSFSMKTAYIPQNNEKELHWDFSHMGPELSREFRGIKVWLPIKLLGVSFFKKNLEEKAELTRWMEGRLKKIRGIQIHTPSQLGIFTFRYQNEEEHGACNGQTDRLLEIIQNRGKLYLSGTEMSGVKLIRVCINSFRTKKVHCEQAIKEIQHCLELL